MKARLSILLTVLCLIALTCGPVLAQATQVDAGACAQAQSKTAPASTAQFLQDLQPAQSATPKAQSSCEQTCAMAHCQPGNVCQVYVNTFGWLVCGCHNPNTGNGN